MTSTVGLSADRMKPPVKPSAGGMPYTPMKTALSTAASHSTGIAPSLRLRRARISA